VAPKSLPHKISVPGLNALFGGNSPRAEEKAPAAPPESKPAALPPMGEGISVLIPASAPSAVVPVAPVASPPLAVPSLHSVPPAEPDSSSTEGRARRRQSKSVRVTQPESKGNPKGRHTLVIGEDVLEELSLIAWAENMSVSAIAREAFDSYLARRKLVIQKARELRDSFEQPREAV
jgi:hypothetical protein